MKTNKEQAKEIMSMGQLLEILIPGQLTQKQFSAIKDSAIQSGYIGKEPAALKRARSRKHHYEHNFLETETVSIKDALELCEFYEQSIKEEQERAVRVAISGNWESIEGIDGILKEIMENVDQDNE